MLKNLFQSRKEFMLYVGFGVLAFLVSISTFALFHVGLGINELIANVYSWILTVTVAYITNKMWVFRSRNLGTRAAIIEVIKFYGGRVFTLIIEELILYIFITRMHCGSMKIKIIAQIVVIVLNYVISTCFVFRKRKKQ